MTLEHSIETIAAIATPPGQGGISVVRISGTEAIALADKGFRGKASLQSAETHTAHVGNFVSPDGIRVDEVVATVFKSPHSYTGEDVVEISCHGGTLITRKIVECLIFAGARHASPGEFTKRAFLNGKMDLSQAEAVADLIHARSEKAHELSLQQLQGAISRHINELREALVRTTGMLELELDFVEDGFELADKGKIAIELESAINHIDGLIRSYRNGRVYRDGVKVVIAGMPNVGKSSLLNALLMENRAIVTEIPGTTRDTIEEDLMIDGILFSVVDTAGLRETVDRAEQEGVRRSHDQVRTSDLLLLVMDGSRHPQEEELHLAQKLVSEIKLKATPSILVINKIDLLRDNETSGQLSPIEANQIVKVSALTGKGLDALRKTLVEISLGQKDLTASSGAIITSARHSDALERSKRSLELSLQALRKGESGEFIAVDLRGAMESLGEITGVVTTDEILAEIFARFCIGK